jgi:hypothetical protein
MILFQRFKISTDFLDQVPKEWHVNLNYQKGIKKLSNMKVVNDAAECGIKLIGNFNKFLTEDEDQNPFLMQIICDYCDI